MILFFYKKYPQHQKLWDELKAFYSDFENTKKLSQYSVDTEGGYHLNYRL